MTYLGSDACQYDIFFSYASADDREVAGRRFVKHLCDDIRTRVEQLLKLPEDGLSVFFDRSTALNPTKGMFKELTKKSAVLVAIVSPNYLESRDKPDSCQEEFEHFATSAGTENSRIFIVQIDETEKEKNFKGMGENYPAAWFYEGQGEEAERFQRSSNNYAEAIEKIAKRLHSKIVEMKKLLDAAASKPKSGFWQTTGRKLILVACADRDGDLAQTAVRMINNVYGVGGDTVEAVLLDRGTSPYEFNGYLNDCHVFIHLLGGDGGSRPQGVPQGMVRYMWDQVQKRGTTLDVLRFADLRTIQNEARMKEIAAEDQDFWQFLDTAENVKKMLPGDFENIVIDQVKKLIAPEPPPPSDDRFGIALFVRDKTSGEVQDLAKGWKKDDRVPVRYPLDLPLGASAAELKEHLASLFDDCQDVVFMRADDSVASASWFGKQIMFFEKHLSQTGAERAGYLPPSAVLCHGPQASGREEIGEFPSVYELEYMNPWSRDRIKEGLLKSSAYNKKRQISMRRMTPGEQQP